ncbi:MAG: glycosyltransferase [Opitutaceae bacterium]
MLVVALAYGVLTPTFDTPTVWRTVLFAVLGCLGVALVLLTPRFKKGRFVILGVWLPAVLLRLALLPVAPSDDVNRYLWEGKLVLNGVSPYAQTADSGSLVEYRDGYWEAMNHKDKSTAYPPLTELLFAAVASVGYHPLVFKCAFIIADCLVIAGILSILRSRGFSEAYAGFYAFNPVALLSFAGEAHFDVWMLAALVWGVWAFDKKRYGLAVSLASIATGIKWVTLPLIPFFSRYQKPFDFFKVGVVAMSVLLLPFLYFWDSISSLAQGLFAFGGTRSFNGPIYDLLLLGLDLPRGLCSLLVVAAFALVILWRWFLRSRFPVDAHIRWILGALIILSPTVHFWYIAWILPFVCLRPSLPWLVLSVASAVYFYVWINPTWGLTLEQRWVFWAPFFLFMAYELWSTRARVAFPFCRSTESSNSIALVIPTLNVGDQLPSAFASIAAQASPADEVICVDAGSTDETRALAEASDLGVTVIESEKGRGQQIAAGIEAAQSDWVCVLHADARLSVDSLELLKRAVSSDLTISGGAFGQRFEDDQAELLPIEMLNDIRALFTRTAFGDQVQFFHRETALKFSLMPKQPLMEDVESSWRIREVGGFAFLGQRCMVSHRSWEASEWIRRFALVMRLVSRYRFARLKSRQSAEALSSELYEEYYKSGK